MKKVILFLLVAALAGCKKEVSELPAPTQTGANTFGAQVKGSLWVAQGFGVVPTAPIVAARYTGGNNIIINARNFGSSPSESEIEIHLQDVTAPGIYLLNAVTLNYPAQSANYAYYVERRFTPTNEWITNAEYTGRVELTKIDTIAKIISGTFMFNAINKYNTPEPIQVTDGRFDLTIN